MKVTNLTKEQSEGGFKIWKDLGRFAGGGGRWGGWLYTTGCQNCTSSQRNKINVTVLSNHDTLVKLFDDVQPATRGKITCAFDMICAAMWNFAKKFHFLFRAIFSLCE